MGRPRIVSASIGCLLMTLPARGEVWWCELAGAGRRPVVVLSRDVAIPRLQRALVAPCTTTIRRLASEVVLEPVGDPIPQHSAVNLAQLRVCRSLFSSTVLVDWLIVVCGRSARRSQSRWTAQSDADTP
jgi:mRNA-degrading endonuclease toxin of MazEF toxin-antitoxin module